MALCRSRARDLTVTAGGRLAMLAGAGPPGPGIAFVPGQCPHIPSVAHDRAAGNSGSGVGVGNGVRRMIGLGRRGRFRYSRGFTLRVSLEFAVETHVEIHRSRTVIELRIRLRPSYELAISFGTACFITSP